MIALSHEYVCRFNVAVNDPFGVSGVERVGNLDSKRQDQVHLQWAVRNAVLERYPVQKLHGDKGLGFVFADLVNCADIGMVQR